MPPLKVTTPLTGGKYYHVYNRGVNHQQIFFYETHYQLFLNLISKYLLNYANVLAYSLLLNHFHMVMYIKEEVLIEKVTAPPKLNEDQKDHNRREAASYVKKDIKRKRKMKLAKKARKITRQSL